MARAMTVAGRATRDRRPIRWSHIATWTIAIVALVLVVLPFIYMISASFTPESLVTQWPLVPWPRALSLENYTYLFNASDVYIGRWFINSLVVTVAITLLTLAISAITAYAFARLRFPGRDVLFYICLSTLMIPFQATLLPIYLLMRYLHLLNTYGAVILPPLASVFGTFLLRQFFLGFPKELEEAATVDGCNKLSVLWRIILPNSGSALVALGVVTFLNNWNELFWPLIALSDPQMYTLPIGLGQLNGEYFGTPGPGVGMAAGVVASVPILVFFFIFQHRIVEGIAMTGIKG